MVNFIIKFKFPFKLNTFVSICSGVRIVLSDTKYVNEILDNIGQMCESANHNQIFRRSSCKCGGCPCDLILPQAAKNHKKCNTNTSVSVFDETH